MEKWGEEGRFLVLGGFVGFRRVAYRGELCFRCIEGWWGFGGV